MKHKTQYLIFALALFIYSCSSSQNQTTMQKIKELHIGMSLAEFEKIMPEIMPTKITSEMQIGNDETIEGLEGGWAFNFKESKLNWYMFNSYSDSINEVNFHKYFVAYKNLKKQLEKFYGKPTEEQIIDSVFKDPYKQRHWGYDVAEAVWETEKEKFKLIFTFMGGKGEYNFLLKLEFQDKNYEYF